MRVRGLKHYSNYRMSETIPSHPMRVRGLKLKVIGLKDIMNRRRTPCGCVD